MGRWLELARQLASEDPCANRGDSANSPPFGTTGTIGIRPLGPRRPTDGQARATLREWHRHLSALDAGITPARLEPKRWRQLVEDSHWLYENYAGHLVREGWSALDIFGVLPSRPIGAVLLDRLQGARNLKLDGEGRAFWTSFGVTFQTCRGASAGLQASGLVPVWEIPGSENHDREFRR